MPTCFSSINIFAFFGTLLILTEPVLTCSIAVKTFSLPGAIFTLFSQTLYPSFLTSIKCVPCGTDLRFAGVVPISMPSKNILDFVGSLPKMIDPYSVVSSAVIDVSFSASIFISLPHISYPSSLTSIKYFPDCTLFIVSGVVPTLLPSMKIIAFVGSLCIAIEPSFP